jgi:pSer/pThr/pTyr-binding forkhead associated (FHA) protein
LSNKGPNFEAEATLVKDHSVIDGLGRPATLPRLAQVRGPGAPREFPLSGAEAVIGRSSQVNICIDSELLSRRHAEVRKRASEYRLTDLDSSNGVFLNGVRVHSAALHGGDTIQIGDCVFVFHEGSS